jgi:acetoin utilization protein AcuC
MKYDFGKAHPLKQIRLKLAFELIKSYGLLDRDDVKVFEPPLAKEEDLLLVHGQDYVNYVKGISSFPDRDYYLHGFGPGDNPPFEGAFDSDSVHVGATVSACDLVMKGEVEHAYSLGGGYHHAFPDKAAGFCVFNDPAIGIEHLKKEWGLKKVLYIDIDAHHGDGVQWIFYSDPTVMTISLHESGRFLFPGTGSIKELGKGKAEGTKVNIPFPMDATDNAYAYAIEEVVVPLVRSFEPEFMIVQCGGDAHYLDPLTHLALTTKAYKEMSASFHSLAHEVMDGRYICVTGGGYDVLACARLWTVMFSEMAGVNLDYYIPDEFVKLCKTTLGYGPSDGLYDEEKIVDDERYVMETTKNIVSEIKKEIFPFHGL